MYYNLQNKEFQFSKATISEVLSIWLILSNQRQPGIRLLFLGGNADIPLREKTNTKDSC